MIYTILAKAIYAGPVQVDAQSPEDAVAQVTLDALDMTRAFPLSLSSPAEWLVREESTQSTVTHLSQAVKGLLDLLTSTGNSVYDEPSVVEALSALLEAESVLSLLENIQRVQNGRIAGS